jgi:hypothetical protein
MKKRKCSPAVQSAICRALEIGVTLQIAANAAGVSSIRVNRWVQRGRKGTEPYASFVSAVSRARSKAISNLTERALGGGKGAANAEWLYLHRYGPPQDERA